MQSNCNKRIADYPSAGGIGGFQDAQSEAHGEAIAAGYSVPDGRRNLGLALVRSGKATEGKAALELSPDAADAKAISALVDN